MPQRNRVDPHGEIVATPLRGQWLGNRGCIHRGHEIVRPWNGKRWIICALEYKGWVAPKWLPGRWTPLFFYDEAVAFAAGHRPCALCRRSDYKRYEAAAGITGADPIDARLHVERLDRRRKRTHAAAWNELPAGAFVERDGLPHLVLSDRLLPWSTTHGYRDAVPRPTRGDACVLTPTLSIGAIVNGYAPQINLDAVKHE